jgi:hypothetical protein
MVASKLSKPEPVHDRLEDAKRSVVAAAKLACRRWADAVPRGLT